MMTGSAVSNREEFYRVARGGKLVCRATELDLAIVRVRADANDPHRIEWCGQSPRVSSSQRLPNALWDVRYATERFCFQ